MWWCHWMEDRTGSLRRWVRGVLGGFGVQCRGKMQKRGTDDQPVMNLSLAII